MHRKLRGAASAGLVLTTLLTAAAPAAEAGTYSVESCKGPSAGVAPIADASGGWRHESSPRPDSGLSSNNGCSSGGTFGVDVGGTTVWPDPYVYSQLRFAPPSDTSISEFEIEWDSYGVPAGASKVGFVSLVTDQNKFEEHVGAGLTNRHWTRAAGLDAAWLTVHTGCQGGNVRCGGTEPGADAWARITRSRVFLRDESAPAGTVHGPGVERGTWTEPQDLIVDPEDRGGGVYGVAFEVDGSRGPIVRPDLNGGHCIEATVIRGSRAFITPRPCKTDPSATTLSVPTTAYTDGEHQVRVLIEDAAGNVRTLSLGTKLFDSHAPVLGAVDVAGSGREGDALQCVVDAIDGQSPAVRYAWFRANADGSGRSAIDGAARDTYTLTSADVGRKVLCRITATDAGGTATGESSLTSGPFADGRTVLAVCEGLPTGPRDPCGDLDGDGRRNRDDDDADGDGVASGHDPDDYNADATGRDVATPSSINTTTTTNTHTATETIRETQTIPDGPVGAINGSFGGPGASLTVHHEGTSSRTVRVPHGRRVVIEGRLRAPDGRGVEGAKLEITTQDRATGSAFIPFGALLTAADGAYKLILPAGPSRTVRVGYRARYGDASFAQTSDVTVLVRAGLQFRLNRTRLRNGTPVRYIGRLLGPRTGHRFVEVQVRVGKRWIVVCSVRTDAKGSYGCAHRFTKTFRRTRYVFRARVRRQATLPYEPTVSRKRSLTVRP